MMTEIKDLKGTIVLTGAAGGIGSGFVTQFLKTAQASEYYCIYMYHPSFPGSLSSFLTKNAPKTHRYELVPLDLSLQSSIRTFASSLNARISSGSLPKIRNLLLIAGAIFNSPARDDGLVFSDEGIEMTFSVNYLSIFLLTLLLLESMDEEGSRIIFAASTTHDPSFGSNAYAIKKEEHKVLFPGVEELKSGAYQPVEGGDKFGAALRRYGCSKLCCVLWMYELQKRLSANPALSKISIIAADPACVGGTDHYEPSTFPSHLYFALKYVLVPLQSISSLLFPNGPLRSTTQVGKDLNFACWDEETLGENPKAVYLDGRKIVGSSPESKDQEKQKRLWGESVGVVGLKKDETALKDWK